MLDWGAEIMTRGGGLMHEGRGIRDGYGVELQWSAARSAPAT